MSRFNCALCVVGVLVIVGLVIHLDRVPSPWWDEGWTLSVARNWMELGHYGRLLAGVPVLRGQDYGFPITGAVALSFWAFGIGIDQARVVAVVFTLGALILLYRLGRRLYSPSIGLASIVVVVGLTNKAEINPLYMGRQVLGEIPALLFLLAGYHCFMSAEKRTWLFIAGAICCWSLALLLRIQARPFFVVAMLVPLIVAMRQREKRSALWFAIGLVGSLVLYALIFYLIEQFSPSESVVSGLTPLLALVVIPQIRFVVLTRAIEFGIPTCLGLCWAFWGLWKRRKLPYSFPKEVRLSLFVLAGSWFGWYVTLSIGWPRYMLPSVFLGSIFVAAMLSEWTNQFNIKWTIEHAAAVLKIRFSLQNLAALASVIVVVASFAGTIKGLYAAHALYADDSIKEVTRFLNTQTPPDAMIETYESELFFLLNRRYHYPPDQMVVELLRYKIFGEKPRIDYDPMVANPDYLVAGFQSTYWDLYDKQLNSGQFQLIQSYPKYRVYRRVRQN